MWGGRGGARLGQFHNSAIPLVLLRPHSSAKNIFGSCTYSLFLFSANADSTRLWWVQMYRLWSTEYTEVYSLVEQNRGYPGQLLYLPNTKVVSGKVPAGTHKSAKRVWGWKELGWGKTARWSVIQAKSQNSVHKFTPSLGQWKPIVFATRNKEVKMHLVCVFLCVFGGGGRGDDSMWCP